MQRVGEPQAANAVLMIRPTAFESNPETLASNAFQTEAAANDDIATRVQAEFEAVAETLMTAGVRVHAFDGRAERDCPDEIFPNNWVSFHPDGTVVLYPMLAPSRRRERRTEIIDALAREHGYAITRTINLTGHEVHGGALEGTGSLVLDRANRVAYACRSPRTNEQALADFAEQLSYTSAVFDAVDRSGNPVYHTNVMMSVGTQFAVVCLGAIADPAVREAITRRLEESGRDIVDITLEQMHAFAANLIELEGRDGTVIALSERAVEALGDSQVQVLADCGELIPVGIPTVETYGGGGLRCMLAEIHLPAEDAAALMS